MGTGFFIIIILTSLQLLESTESRVVDYGTTIVLGDTTEVDNEDVTTRQTEKASGSEETGTTTEISIPGAAASATNSTILQVNVLKELEAIWDYTESVKDPGLKSSLMSLVHFTYARVQSEPEERLDRLKYLLTKLRARLNEAEDS